MRRRYALAPLLLGVACAPPRPLDPSVLVYLRSASTPARVRVLSLNTHRFFDRSCDSSRCGAGAYEALPSREEFEQKAARLADAIARARPDVVCAQEVESEEALDALRERLGGAMRTAVLGETGGAGSVDVAVLSRDLVREVRRHRRAHPLVLLDGRRTSFSRELLEVHLDHGGRRVVVFCAHFRSKVRDDPQRRAAEGAAAAEIVSQRAREHPDALLLLAGDLNDTPGSDALNALQRSGMARVAESLPPGEDVTWRGRAGAFALDHIFYATAASGRLVDGSVAVLRDADGTYGGSDHAALRADFSLGAAP